jgi:hypothetical protein
MHRQKHMNNLLTPLHPIQITVFLLLLPANQLHLSPIQFLQPKRTSPPPLSSTLNSSVTPTPPADNRINDYKIILENLSEAVSASKSMNAPLETSLPALWNMVKVQRIGSSFFRKAKCITLL